MLTVLDGLTEFERELTPYINGRRSSSGLRSALGRPISPDPSVSQATISSWQPPKSPAASGVNQAASRGGAIQALRKTLCETHCHEKCHRHPTESGRTLTPLSGDNFPDGTPRSVG